MKATIFSDLHINFHQDMGKSLVKSLPSADLAISAGDISDFYSYLAGLRMLCDKYSQVICVLGNHEYYHADSMNQVEDLLSDLVNKLGNLVWLNNSRFEYNGRVFCGGTLWFADNPWTRINQRGFNDFVYISKANDGIFLRNKFAVDFFKGVGKGNIVITHHSPSYKSISPRFVGSDLNCYFVCDLEAEIIKQKPALWIHGHMHNNSDYQIGSTRVLCNPFGYPNENEEFFRDLVIEI